MRIHRQITSITCALMLVAIIGGTVHAGTQSILYDGGGGYIAGTDTGVQLTTPDTYPSCTATSDRLTTTGVGTRQLKGQVIVEYIAGTGRVLAPNGYYPVDQTGDLNLNVSYPPVAEWPSNEIHVDLQLELYENGLKVASLGAGQDWDIWCTDKPPPPPPSVGFEGCTPGYWKQEQHFDSWVSYSTNMTFNAAFGVGPSNITLLQALQLKGGGADALMRHATAALLNAASSGVDYYYQISEIQQIVEQAFSTNTKEAYESAKDLLAQRNEAGCGLN
ncbi:MAG: hypothetical protein M3R24_08355 [Chloroflexota bacterium]|nr:hypothetical protein [Chloroflexota bacterium]